MKYRLLTQSWFMPKNLKIVEDRIRQIARETVDQMLDQGGTCDFARNVAAHYPLRVIMDILGVPPEEMCIRDRRMDRANRSCSNARTVMD